jgi:PiT family inorganic phosphate transporter
MSAVAIILVIVVLAYAWSIGAHYTGACMGMPYGSGSIGLWPALIVMAVLAFFGALIASHRVEVTVGMHLIDASRVTLWGAVSIIAAAFIMTTIYTAVKVPTSTIQILVFSVAGMAFGAGIPIHWGTIGALAGVWVLAPPAALALGYGFTRGFDRVSAPVMALAAEEGGGDARPPRTLAGVRTLSRVLVVIGAAASFTMGANDVSNATGVFTMTHLFTVWTAGLIGGIGLLVGVLTWGQPLLKKVAFDVVHVDLNMASAAQLVQAVVVFLAVSFGFFTSMNQALVGAMAGAGLARGRHTVQWPAIWNIVKGWLMGPPSGFVLAFMVAKVIGFWAPL